MTTTSGRKTGQWTSWFHKRQLFGPFTQSTADAIDVRRLSVQSVRFRADNLATSVGLDVYLEESLTNEDGTYVRQTTPLHSFTTSGGSETVIISIATSQARYIRLAFDLTAFGGAGNISVAPSVEAEILKPTGVK